MKDYLTAFVNENPEFLPARIAGGTRNDSDPESSEPGGEAVISIERIRPGMSAEEMQRVREEIVRVASQTLGVCRVVPAKAGRNEMENQIGNYYFN